MSAQKGASDLLSKYDLPVSDLRAAESNEWRVECIAVVMGLSTNALMRGGIGDSQDCLAVLGEIIGMLRQTYGGDDATVRQWLRTPQGGLAHMAPLDLILSGQHLQPVRQWVTRHWLGDPD